MHFTLSINFNSRVYNFQVEPIPVEKAFSKSFERFKLSGGGRVVILQTNRPMLQAKGLKKVPITWKVIEGEVKYPKALEEVQKKILRHLNGLPVDDPKPVPKPLIYEPPKEQYSRKHNNADMDWGGQFRDNKKAQ